MVYASNRRTVSLAGASHAPAPAADIIADWGALERELSNFLAENALFGLVKAEEVSLSMAKEALETAARDTHYMRAIKVVRMRCRSTTYTSSRAPVLKSVERQKGIMVLHVPLHQHFACELDLRVEPPSSLLQELHCLQEGLCEYAKDIPEWPPLQQSVDTERTSRQERAVREATASFLVESKEHLVLIGLKALMESSKHAARAISVRVVGQTLRDVLPKRFSSPGEVDLLLERLDKQKLVVIELRATGRNNANSAPRFKFVVLSEAGQTRVRQLTASQLR